MLKELRPDSLALVLGQQLDLGDTPIGWRSNHLEHSNRPSIHLDDLGAIKVASHTGLGVHGGLIDVRGGVHRPHRLATQFHQKRDIRLKGRPASESW